MNAYLVSSYRSPEFNSQIVIQSFLRMKENYLKKLKKSYILDLEEK